MTKLSAEALHLRIRRGPPRFGTSAHNPESRGYFYLVAARGRRAARVRSWPIYPWLPDH